MQRLRGNMGGFCGRITVLILLAGFPVVAAAQASGALLPKSGGSAAAAAQTPTTVEQSGDKAAIQTGAKPAINSQTTQRQAQILADTNRLLQLAQELKIEVSKSNKDILSFAVVKKADAIEKLAKNLKERMRTE